MTELDLKTKDPNDAKPVLCAVPSNKVYLEDCTEALKRFSDGHFDIAVVDPPYGIGANKMQLGNGKRKIYRGEADWDNAIPTAEYWEQLFRVSKNQIVWGGNYFADYLGAFRCFICWDKTIHGNSYADCELAWTSFDKVARYYRKNIAQVNSEGRIHPTQKPITLYDFVLKEFAEEGNLILDTHVGSGSSRIACAKAGLNFTGFEIDTDHYEAQEKRFKDFVSQLRMF